MLENHHHTALLIFSRTVKEEAEIKQFAGTRGSHNSHLEIAKALFHKTLLLGEKSGLHTFISLSNTQIGCDFGEKLAHEAQNIFNKGFKNLIIVGSDCPDLSLAHIHAAASLLEHGQSTIIGPDHNQGAYLIGLTYKQFNKTDFEKLPWQTDSLLIEWTRSFGKTTFLEHLRDIDSTKDLNHFLSLAEVSNRFTSLLMFLLLGVHINFLCFSKALKIHYHYQSRFFRGPPPLV